MPGESTWASFFDPESILDRLGLNAVQGTVIDVGCGYGSFTLPAAQRSDKVIALDVEADLVELVRRKVATAGLMNVEVRLADATAGSLGVEPHSAEAVLLFNLLHCENPVGMLHAASTALRPEGRVAIIHWRSDIPTPRGPDLSIRPRPEDILAWLREAGFGSAVGPLLLPPFHFGIVGKRRCTEAKPRCEDHHEECDGW